jgi:hypothetical protein
MWRFGRKGKAAGDRPAGRAATGGPRAAGSPAATSNPAGAGRSPGAGGASVSCDVCNAELGRAQCYSVPTATIVMSEAYWRRRAELSKIMLDLIGSDERIHASMFGESVRIASGSTTPWLICENCSELFIFDRDSAPWVPQQFACESL